MVNVGISDQPITSDKLPMSSAGAVKCLSPWLKGRCDGSGPGRNTGEGGEAEGKRHRARTMGKRGFGGGLPLHKSEPAYTEFERNKPQRRLLSLRISIEQTSCSRPLLETPGEDVWECVYLGVCMCVCVCVYVWVFHHISMLWSRSG